MTTTRGIIIVHLVTSGFDGLLNLHYECSCLTDELAPCGSFETDCEAGYRGASKEYPGEWALFRNKDSAQASLKATGQSEARANNIGGAK